ncbi:MAG: hypothetical protein ACD_38C00086G0021 [uncultured bacterium]|uniref:Uncharacterized protein n=1 Tax=Candidatus Daviesbacteria bacterium GW2011_GWC2_40_12 TaxID=1618431 RepID=A0A0G0QNP1_9BACT|nr:MAG: hypothetical protein ACD_38C00086G0021 [uncultured bacterium]KKQ83899.1 MAG: hypothetical protein UT04_C0023G0011 [Candidatus Daviesbacteria bacterium GW2011_GWF2_38_7]KKR16980.1 MAG: hypothetical protein UT45_C0003G0010 [Candidatus Daviesbacteria bacterium GW2011_GWA2_39_33]KKR42044.1 MAG: hypothetical protein UT77_C0004G0028 [Candidatus Daviesbacteria bacterium GW2011_GWC2_40_12]OGE20812.1 MAG: hypothetical protein A2778_06090 [Candidatus Daviesbacteria bacterium RIFCSPHIGHO2_01_FULL_
MEKVSGMVKKFKETFGDAPELKKPWTRGKYSVPLKLRDIHYRDSLPFAKFEGISGKEDDGVLKVRVDYAGSLDLRREQAFIKSGTQFTLNYVDIRFNTGPVDIIYSAKYDHLIENSYTDERAWPYFSRELLIQFTGRRDMPLAMAEYFSSNRRIQYALYMTCGEFGDLQASLGAQAGEKDDSGLGFAKVDIGALPGAHIQELRNSADNIKTETSPKPIPINGVPMNIDDSPYIYRVLHSQDHQEWGQGRLALSRLHFETGSVMMLSVPECVNQHEYMSYMIGDQWNDILHRYPVRFVTVESGKPRQWLHTFGRDDKLLEVR